MQKIGEAIGLAWTPDGSRLIQIKCKIKKGTGKLYIEGDMGHDFLVSIENIILLLNKQLNMSFDNLNITVTMPTKIDGASAGLALFVAIHSAINKQPVNQNLAFTGIVSEAGLISGVEEIGDKAIAAKRAGLSALVMPSENLNDLAPGKNGATAWDGLTLCPVLQVFDALAVAL